MQADSIWDAGTLRTRIAARAAAYFPELTGPHEARLVKSTQRAYSHIYELEIHAGREARRIVVKRSSSARREYEELISLWEIFSAHPDCGVARPLDYLEDGPALAMEAVGGSSLQALFPRWYWGATAVSAVESACRLAGDWLSLYHRTPSGSPPASLDVENKYSDFRRTWKDLTGLGFNGQAGERISRYLAAMVKPLAARRFGSVRIHGDFSIDNIRLDRGRVVVLDISGARCNAPELDIAAFLNSLLLIRLTGWIPLRVFQALRSAFLRGYGNHPSVDTLAVSFLQATGMVDVLWELWQRRPSRLTRALCRPVLAGLADILDERTITG